MTRERHGVGNADGSFLDVRDCEGLIKIVLGSGGVAGPQALRLAPDDARYIARKLYRLARRAETEQYE